MVDPVKAELGPSSWKVDVADWLKRALRGPGVKGPLGSTTAFWMGASSWGGPLLAPCSSTQGSGSPNQHHHHGGGGGGGGGNQGPLPTALPAPSPNPTATPRRRPIRRG
jgi:hypothetical protein